MDPESRASCTAEQLLRDCDASIDLHSEGSDHEVQPADANRLLSMYKRFSSKDEQELVKPLTACDCLLQPKFTKSLICWSALTLTWSANQL